MSERRTRARGRVEEVVENSETSVNRKSDENDISFMDTEPMDVSNLNTEPMELHDSEEDEEVEASGSGSETSVTDVEKESEQGDESNNEDNNDNESYQFMDAGDDDNSENESGCEQAEVDFPDDISHMFDESSSGSSQPPAVDITMASSHEVKRIYSDLIDSCRGFDDDLSFTEGSNRRVLKDNIRTGQALFQQLEMSLSNTFSESEGGSAGINLNLGNSVTELYLAAQHTQRCIIMLNHAVNNAINLEAAFKVDDFLKNLRNSCLDNVGGYSVLSSVRKLAFTASTVAYSVSHFKTVMGCIDTETFRILDEAVPETAKIRMKRKKDEVKEEDATQTEIVNQKSKPIIFDDEIKNDTQDGLATDVLRFVRNSSKEQDGAPINMLQVAHADNLPDVLSRLFGVAFLVRDGFVSLSTPGDGDDGASCTALTLKPDKPPKNDTGKGNERKQRNQHIASFSVKLLKHLVASGKTGDNR